MKRFALTALLLSACTMLGQSHTANTLNGTLEGKIVDWPADLKNAEVRLQSWHGDHTAATAPIDAQGHFKLTLDDLKKTPDKLVKTSALLSKSTLIGDVCQGQGTVTPDSSLFQQFQAVIWVDGKAYGDISLDTSPSLVIKKGDAEAGLFYFSESTTLNGGVKCPPPYDNLEYQGVYPAGWSLVRAAQSVGPAGLTVYRHDPAASLTGLSWRLFKEAGRVGLSVDSTTRKIRTVAAGLSAEQAGVKVGDEIISVDGKPYLESGGLRGEPNTKVVLVVRRDGKELTFELTRSFTRTP